MLKSWMSFSCKQVILHILVQKDGMALVSGFSGHMLRLLLERRLETLTPHAVMLAAISGGACDAWTVVD